MSKMLNFYLIRKGNGSDLLIALVVYLSLLLLNFVRVEHLFVVRVEFSVIIGLDIQFVSTVYRSKID